jgi:hypothetical protein
MDVTAYEVEKDNLVVTIKGTKPDEVVGCQYIVYVKKRVFDTEVMGNLREYVPRALPLLSHAPAHTHTQR